MPDPTDRPRTFRRTETGVVVTADSLKSFALITGCLVTLIGGATAAVRLFDHAKDAPSRNEFVEHVRNDSLIHGTQLIHAAWQDSLIAQEARDNHAVSCLVAKYPLPLCRDQLTAVQAGRVP